MKNPEADQPYPNDWDDLFRQRFAEFQSEPSANALTRILASLPRASSTFDRRKAWLLGGLGLLLLLGGFWYVSQHTSLVSTQLTTKSIETRQPTKVSAKRTRDAATTSQTQLSSKASQPLANGVSSEAITPNNKNVGSSDNKVATNASDKTGIHSETKTGVDLRGKTEASPHRQESLASAPSKASLPTERMDDVAIKNTVATGVGTNRPKTIIKPSRTAPKSTALARIRHSTGSNKALSASKGRVSEGDELVGTQAKSSAKTSQANTDLAASPASLTKEPMAPTGKSSEWPQQIADSPTLPQTGQQQSDQELLLPVPQAVSLAFLATQALQPIRLSLSLPDITLSALPQSAPQQPAMSQKRPVVFVGIMPLYSYQQIAPIITDAVWVKNIRSQQALSSHRVGLRLQAGIEWPLSKRMSVRTSLIYNQLNQQVSYTTPSEKPDSIRVERVDDKTVRLTPYYSDTQVTRQTNWHYMGIGSDLVWQLGKLGAWRHSVSAGASVGTYLAQGASQTTQPLSGFVQAAYGIERPLTPSVWLRIAPTVQYGLSTISDSDGLFHIRPYTYGLTISLRK